MAIFYSKKSIFIRVPKVASTSMHEAIGEDGDGPMHETISGIKSRISNDMFSQYFKFGFVRNPWDWILSWTAFKQKRGWAGWDNFDFNTWIEGIGRVAESRDGIYWRPGVEFASPSKDAVSCGNKVCRAKMGYPCVCLVQKQQHEFLCDKDKNVIVDFVGKFENLDHDWATAASMIKNYTFKQLKVVNKSDHDHYKKVYNDKTSEIVFNLFKEDAEIFNYSF